MSSAAIYRCRRCGATYSDATCPRDAQEVVVMTIRGLAWPPGVVGAWMAPRMLDTHQCQDGSWGVADFIGARENTDD